MTKVKNLIAIFKRNLLFFELQKLLKKEGFKINLKKDFKSLKKSNFQNSVLIFQITSENELRDILSLFKKNQNSSNLIFIMNKKIKPPIENFNFKTFNQPIMFNDLLRYIKTLETTFGKEKLNVKFGNKLYDRLNSKLINYTNGDFIKLTDLENKLISFILNKNDGCTKNEILKNVWEHAAKLETHTMESLIYRLRKKIEDDPNQPRTLIQINKKYYLNRS